MDLSLTCRDELRKATKKIIEIKGRNEFSIKEVIDYMNGYGTQYKKSTISTHISKCCINASVNHSIKFKDYERIGQGLY